MRSHDLRAQCKTDPGSRIVSSRVQPLKYAEDAVEVPWFDTDSVVGHGKHVFDPASLVANDNRGRRAAPKLDGVADKILEQLNESGSIAGNDRQLFTLDPRAGFFDGDLKVCHRILEHRIAIDTSRFQRLCSHSGIQQQVVDQL